MNLVMTLIAGPGAGRTLPDLVAGLAASLPLAGMPEWLAPGMAFDLQFAGIAGQAAEAAARQAIGDAAIDVVVQPPSGRKKRVLVADFEATIIENEMLDELADFIGRRSQIAEITRRAMNGELDFAAALAERVATELGFERVVANRLLIADGRIAGTVEAPLVTGDTKRETLVAFAGECAVPRSATLAVGDGANDLPMLLAAGLGIAFRAKPAVAAAARWRIDHADLRGLLYAQGYRQEEIVDA